MPDPPKPLSKSKLLIGEGIEETLFFNALLDHLGISHIQVEQYGGKFKLKGFIETLLVRSGYRNLISLGITRDADDDADNAFKSVCNFLNVVGLAVPNSPSEFVGENPKVGILILPCSANSGMLEDMCLSAIEEDPKMKCVDSLFDCVRQASGLLPTDMSKARVHAWLSTQLEPDKRLGEAAKAGFLPWNSPAFDLLKRFLQEM